jgi:predicted TIM-barrel fold metal-dependent hydrolase
VNDDNVIVVSCDGHAGVPKERWEEYLPSRFHELLPQLRSDNVKYPMAVYLLTARRGMEDLDEHQDAHRDDWHGLHDPVLRLADMDSEGIAAELIYNGDPRLGDMFHHVTGRDFGIDAWEAGAKGWNRWSADSFGFAMDRFLVCGAIGPCVDMDVTVAELEWIADHGFAGTYGPGFMRHQAMPPLYDAYWEPFWTTCEERGITIVVHAGFGSEVGVAFPHMERMYDEVARVSPTLEPDDMLAHADALSEESMRFFVSFVSASVPARRPMWQMMLGGVFDRHPGLRLLLSEIRVDWIPDTLQHLDAVFERNRADLPTVVRPSELWASNCLAGASFIHKAEVEMRHDIGVETILFGRDYPHPEGTWPHTREWMQAAFAGIPEHELRLMLGENAIRFFDLDRDRLQTIAKRIGPSAAEITGAGPVRPELLDNIALRGGFLKPAERGASLEALDQALAPDLAAVTS